MNEDIKIWLKEKLSCDEERYQHVLGAEIAAKKLAKRFDVDKEKAALAALLHDTAKCIPYPQLLDIIKENNILVSEMELLNPKTLHAPVGAFIVKKELGINDPEMLDAIRYHTIGRIHMTMLDKIVFLADKIESFTREKKFRKKVLNRIKETNNIDEGVIICYKTSVKSFLKKQLIIYPDTISVWNELVSKLNR